MELRKNHPIPSAAKKTQMNTYYIDGNTIMEKGMYNKDHLKRDPDTIVIRQATESEHQAVAEAVESGRPTISVFYANRACYRKSVLDASGLHLKQPAMHEVCLSIINKDQNAPLPRGMDRRISKSARQVPITYEQPIEHTFQ